MRRGDFGQQTTGRRLRGAALVALVVTLRAATAVAMPSPDDTRTSVATTEAVPAAAAPLSGETLAQQVDALRLEVSELRTGVQQALGGQEAPAWAAQMRDQLDQRIERMAEMQERLAARIETPAPRLDEPIVLFTVASCTLLLGFVVGRGVQRRSNRRDLRLPL